MQVREFDPAGKRCAFCCSSDLRSFRAHAFNTDNLNVSITECQSCFFAWQYPVSRSDKESTEYFGSAYLDEGKKQSAYFDPNVKLEIAKLEIGFVNSLGVRGKRLLDVGAGAGVFAGVAADHEWQVTAVDPALDVSHITSSNVRPITGTIRDIPSDEQFDVVTLWDVIEHVPAPVSLVESARDLLRPGGWFVVETGNYKSADRIIGGLDHWIFQLDHRWYFAPDSLGAVLERAGFSELTFAKRVLRPNWKGTADYSGPSMTHLAKSVIKRPWNVRREVHRYRRLQLATSWPLAGLGIFCAAGRRS